MTDQQIAQDIAESNWFGLSELLEAAILAALTAVRADQDRLTREEIGHLEEAGPR